MKRFSVLSLLVILFVATFTTSCSMQNMTFKNLEKKGYVMEQLTPAQQLEMAPLLSAFPTLNMTAEGYLASTYTVTYIYNGSMTDFQSYAAILLASGFTNVAGTYSKIDRTAGIQYCVSAKAVQATKKQSYLLVTYTTVTL